MHSMITEEKVRGKDAPVKDGLPSVISLLEYKARRTKSKRIEKLEAQSPELPLARLIIELYHNRSFKIRKINIDKQNAADMLRAMARALNEVSDEVA